MGLTPLAGDDWKGANTADPRDIAASFAKLSPEAQAAYQQSMAATVVNHIGNAASDASASAYFQKATGARKAMLEIAYGGPDKLAATISNLKQAAALPAIAVPGEAPAAAHTVASALKPMWKDALPSWYSIAALATGRPGAAAGMMARPIVARGVAAAAQKGELATSAAVARLLASTRGVAGIDALAQGVAARSAANAASVARARAALSRFAAPRAAGVLNLGFGPNRTPGEVR